MNGDEIERQLRDAALRPRDEAFTRRVLEALPGRTRPALRAHALRSFALATRFGLLATVLAAAQHWYLSGPRTAASILAIVLFTVPVLAAVAYVCGPVVPRSARRLFWRMGGNWR